MASADIFDKDGKKIELGRTSFLSRFVDRNKERATTRASIADPNKAFSAPAESKPIPTLQTLNNTTGVNNSFDNTRPDRLPGAPIKLANIGQGNEAGRVIGDVDSFKKNALSEASSPASAAERRFRAPVGRGATFAERGIDNRGTFQSSRPLNKIGINNALPSKEGLNRHQYQQVLKNKGDLDVQNVRNLGSLEEQRLQGETAITTQGMRTKGLRDIADAKQTGVQNKAQIKNAQNIKDKNIQRLKGRYDLLKDVPDDMIGDPEYAKNLADARTEYLRATGAGTTGIGNDQAQKYL